MSPINWKNLLEHEGDAFLSFLERLEDSFIRMIRGIAIFIWKKIPELFRHVLSWLQLKMIYVSRVVVRLGRVAGVFLAWVGIVFGPIAVYPGIVTFAWLTLAIVGSVWGIQRQLKKHNWTLN
jgi:hypothetical protein